MNRNDTVHPHSGHLSEWTLDLLAQGELPGAERVRADAHLVTCAHCAGELEEMQALVASLAALPEFAPSAAFADMVMSRVVLAPEAVRARRWLPQTARGWMLVGVATLAPVVALYSLLLWYFALPMLHASVFVSAAGHWLGDTARSGAVRLAGAVVGSATYGALSSLAAQITAASPQQLTSAAMFAVLALPLFGWGLDRILRTPMGEITHAH